MRRLGVVLLALSACGRPVDARVHIDVASLWQQYAQSVDVIHVRVFDSSGLQQDGLLTDLSSELIVDVLAGSLRFEVESLSTTGAPSFFGEQARIISPSETIVDVLVPVFPAGGVAGTVSVTDGTPIPVGSVVICAADVPRNDADAPNTRELPINTDGTFVGTLLDGDTTLTVTFAAGVPYSGTTQTTVVRERIVGGLTVAVAP